MRHGGARIFVILEDRPGSIKEAVDIIRKYGFSLQSILTSYAGMKEGFREVVIRTKGDGDFETMRSELEKAYKDIKIKKR